MWHLGFWAPAAKRLLDTFLHIFYFKDKSNVSYLSFDQNTKEQMLGEIQRMITNVFGQILINLLFLKPKLIGAVMTPGWAPLLHLTAYILAANSGSTMFSSQRDVLLADLLN